MKDLRAKYGEYAVVTGASSGIGEEFARQLAAAGVNVVLVARRRERLEALAADLTARYGTSNEVVVLDLLADGAVDRLSERIAGLDVGMLVVSAGMATAGRFVDHALADETDVLALDAAVPLRLVHRFGGAFARRRRGAVIMVSSSLAGGPVPYQANYAAAKAYVLSLGQALHHELKPDGVDVLVVSPGQTQTEGLGKIPGIDFDRLPGGAGMRPAKVVGAALRALGRRSHVVPGAVNAAADLFGRHILPRRLTVRLYGGMMGRALTEPERSAA